MPRVRPWGGATPPTAPLLIVGLLLLLALLALPPARAHAADDSNAGKLVQVPTLTPQELGSALGALSQGTNDSQLQQLISQFQSQLSSGNYTAASSTLSQMQSESAASQGSGSSQSLNALLQSLSVGSNGASLDTSTLASLLNQAEASGQSNPALSVNLQTLANLVQYVNATMATQLLQSSDLLGQGANLGGGTSAAAPPTVALPKVSGVPGLSVPSIAAPSLPVGSPSAALPSIAPLDFALPLLAAVVAVALLYLSRGRMSRLAGLQALPGTPTVRPDRSEAGEAPEDPRGRIEFYFARAVNLMVRRGVPKVGSDTHREFSSMCQDRPERTSVVTISSLYERAKFSGQEVGAPEAYLATASYLAMERAGR